MSAPWNSRPGRAEPSLPPRFYRKDLETRKVGLNATRRKSTGLSSKNPRLAQVTKSFQKQGVMKLLGGRISLLSHGLVEITANNRPAFSQQDGFVHAGIMATLADNAAGYATLSTLPPGSRVLAVEFKLNFMRPAVGDMLRGRGRVRRLGRTLSLCEVEVEARQNGKWITCAWGSETVYCIKEKETEGITSVERRREKLRV